MSFKKLKLAAGIVGLAGVILAAACYILSLVIANTANASGQDTGFDMLAIAIVYIIFSIPVAVSAVVEFVFSILYISAKFKRRPFYIVGCVLTILDFFVCFADLYFAIIISQVFTKPIVVIMSLVCLLLAVAGFVLKIICAVKFKKAEDLQADDRIAKSKE
ncbi:MAG: hypothetical protein ACI4QI_08460 [Candidatus Coproplasma sp.]